MPDVQQVAMSAGFAEAVILATSETLSTLTYVVPPTTPVSPTFASGHLTVTPLPSK
jgi:hypothetical protein